MIILNCFCGALVHLLSIAEHLDKSHDIIIHKRTYHKIIKIILKVPSSNNKIPKLLAPISPLRIETYMQSKFDDLIPDNRCFNCNSIMKANVFDDTIRYDCLNPECYKGK